ncbi:MAG: hypothetical protein J7M29_10685, partial [Verrucomicrobia bacterium]|nr:hypothetical protein [Verrucomicrobiota bacterium]
MQIPRYRIAVRAIGFALLALALWPVQEALGETIARCGRGWLERVEGRLVLHVKGSPYEMGYQHGALLKEHVRSNLNYLLHVKGDTALVQLGPLKLKPAAAVRMIVGIQERYVPKKYLKELEGLARAAGESLQLLKILFRNIPFL